MALQFTRNATVYVELTDGASPPTTEQTWKLSVLDGFSFTQSINSSEITINEAGSTSRRARLLFNDSLAPVEWSLSTYARPFAANSNTEVRCPEEALWAMMFGADAYTSGIFSRDGFVEVIGLDPLVANTLVANGPEYEITTVGDINWRAIGAEESSPILGTKFIYNGQPIVGTSGVVKETKNINSFIDDIDVPADDINSFNLSKSNISSLSDNWNLYFAFEDGTNNQYYKLDSAVVNSVSIDFDIDGIATISWSGFAKALSDLGTSAPAALATPREEGLTSTTNFIRNRISTVDLVRKDKLVGSADTNIVTGITVNGINNTGQAVLNVDGDISQLNVGDTVFVAGVVTSSQTVSSINGQAITLSANLDGASVGGEAVTITSAVYDRYDVVITGGNFTIENNLNYLTPEELGVVNAPLANITGARSISGSLTCYLDNDQSSSKSGELFADLVSDTSTIRNVFDLGINIGGVSVGSPRLCLKLPTAHLEVPTINVEDLLTLEVNFHGQVSSGNVDLTNEATIQYKA